jgi:hypothetical protein
VDFSGHNNLYKIDNLYQIPSNLTASVVTIMRVRNNGIITNYKDIKALLVSVILSLVRKDLDVHGHDSFENLEGDSSRNLTKNRG